MAKPSSKKVTRAARTSGGRTARGATPWGWYLVMAIVVVLGSVGVYTSRQQRIDKATGPTESPKTTDHWHAALGVYECDKFTANVKDSGRDPMGIHTHGDGIVHIHPFVKSAAGKNATLGVFFDTVGMKVNATSFKVPGEEKTYRDGQKCNGKTGEVQLFVNSQKRSGNPATYRPRDRDMIVLAFAPKDANIPKTPPSAPNLDKLTDVGPQVSLPPGMPTPGSTPGASDVVPPPTAAPGGSSTTAPAQSSSTTAAP
jgi:hypothetical protein